MEHGFWQEFTAAINGRYLKKYYPSIEVDR
jgi:hypothetical protein